VLAMSMVDHGFEPRSGQTKDYKIGIFLLLCYKAYSFKEWEQRLGWHRIKIICPYKVNIEDNEIHFFYCYVILFLFFVQNTCLDLKHLIMLPKWFSCKSDFAVVDTIYYSQTCIKRSPFGQRKSDLLIQVINYYSEIWLAKT
jgi:hypothetical protein